MSSQEHSSSTAIGEKRHPVDPCASLAAPDVVCKCTIMYNNVLPLSWPFNPSRSDSDQAAWRLTGTEILCNSYACRAFNFVVVNSPQRRTRARLFHSQPLKSPSRQPHQAQLAK